MEKITAKKKDVIIKLYLSGLSYDEIAKKTGVSKGTVANVVAELKAGSFPEAADIGEHIEQLRELSLDLKSLKLSPGQCAAGLLILNRINECGLDPADIGRWEMILKSVNNQDDAQEFARLIYSIQEVQEKTGLSLEELENKAQELEKKAADLEPIADKLKESKTQLAELTNQRKELTSTVDALKQKYELLTPRVNDLERREQALSNRIMDLEAKALKAETTLSALNSKMKQLNYIGLSLKELAEFSERLQVIAQNRSIKPAELRSRLLQELETLDKILTLEALIKSRQNELDKMEQAIASTKKEIETTKAASSKLKQEKANLDAEIKETRERVGREIAQIVPIAQDTISQLGKDLRRGNEEALAEVHRLRDEAMEVGREVGRFKGMLEANEWLKELLDLVWGKENVEGKRVRTIALPVLRSIAAWLKRQGTPSLSSASLSLAIDRTISELEKWEV